MKTKQTLLELLAAQEGDFLSGEKIAHALGVSRAAVWKAISALREDGYPIQAVTNKGYRLAPDEDIISADALAKLIKTNLEISTYRTVSSTNDMARSFADSRQPRLIVADMQTAGRGRRGRSFCSPEDTGLYMSLLLYPDLSPQKAVGITAAAAVAVAGAIEALFSRECGIKWVNDVYIDGKKVCGILTEAALSVEGGGLDYAVLGIGVNLYTPSDGFPKELAPIVTAVCPDKKQGNKNRLCSEIVNRFFDCYLGGFAAEYKRRSVVLGREISVIKPDCTLDARAVDIDDECRLQVQYPDGSREWLYSGEISVKL